MSHPLNALARLLEPGQLLTNFVELITYEVDAAIDRGTPDGVVLVKSAEDVTQVIRWAAQNRVPVVARGAGTGLSGGAVAEHGGIILEFSRLNRLLELDSLGRSVVVEPGLVNLKLDETVKKLGLYFPPDPASGRSATLGGNIAENAGGPHCFKYGVTTNYLTGLEVVLSDGRKISLGGRALDYPEYDLLSLVAGSEGTLGVITQASFRLLRNPPAVKTMMAAFDTVEQAGQAVSAIIARGLTPATMEFMDHNMMRIIEDYAHAGLPTEAGAALIIEVDGFPESLSPQMDEITAILKTHTRLEMRAAQSAEERDKIWYGRKSAAGAMARLSPAYYLLDGTVPRSQLAHTLDEINRLCTALELRVAYVFHAGDGNLHPFVLIEDPKDAALMERVYEAGRRIMEICVSQGGSITGEHGVGLEKRKFMPLMYSAAELGAMQDVKAVFDPQDLLNPGKIFPKPSSDLQPSTFPPSPSQPSTFNPSTPQEAVDAIRALTAAGQSFCVQGAGTKSAGRDQSTTVLSTRGLCGIRQYALEDLYVTVGAGTPLAELQAELGRDKMWAPIVSPWPEATVGGILATNFNAPLRMRYGALRDLLLAATVALPDGRLIHAGRPVVKNVAGYDLPKLFVGAQGTLGLIVDATLKLAPQPRACATLIAPLDDASSGSEQALGRGLEWGAKLLPVCLNASALLLTSHISNLSDGRYALIYTAEGLPEDVAAELAQARGLLQAGGASGLQQIDAPSGSQVWADFLAAARSGALAVQPVARLGVAPKDLPELLKRLALILGAAPFVADLANGLLYTQGVDVAVLREAAHPLGGYAVLLAGPAGVEPWGYSPASLTLMRALKARWDPQGLLNPDAFLV